jgi:hypothetical protein
VPVRAHLQICGGRAIGNGVPVMEHLEAVDSVISGGTCMMESPLTRSYAFRRCPSTKMRSAGET